MSYGLKYRLSFDSVSGTPCEINILEAGYEGPVEKRNLGSAPVLKMVMARPCGVPLWN